MHIKTILSVSVAVATIAAQAIAQESPGSPKLTVHPLRGGVYWVSGGRSNAAFIVGDKGVVVFDTQMTRDAGALQLAEIAKVTSKPVDTVLLSHADPDHVGGLAAYPLGVNVILQENTRSEIQASAADPTAPAGYGPLYKSLLPYLPPKTIGSSEWATIDGVRMELLHVAPAHTSGDLAAFLPKQRIVLAGDIVTTNTGRFPAIHYASGGSSLGWIESMKVLLDLDADTYVSGHGDIETKAQLRARLRDAEERREQIKALVNENKTLAEVKQALPEQATGLPFAEFTETTYDELTRGYPPAGAPWLNLIHK